MDPRANHCASPYRAEDNNFTGGTWLAEASEPFALIRSALQNLMVNIYGLDRVDSLHFLRTLFLVSKANPTTHFQLKAQGIEPSA